MYKVTHISTVHKPFDTRIFVKECSSLAKLGFDVSLLVPIGKPEVRNQVKILPLPFFKNKIFRSLFSWIPTFFRAKKLNSDLYHFHDPELIVLGFFLSLFGKKVVYDVHEDYELQILNKEYLSKRTRRIMASVYKGLEKIMISRFSLIVTATSVIRDNYLRIHKNVIDIKNYPFLEEFTDSRASFEQKQNEICYIGSISKIRGVIDCVKSIEYLNDVKLNLGGDYLNLKNELEKESGWKNTIKYGFVNRDQMREILFKSKVGLVVLHPVPNYIEALPVKMFEYMAAGVPVICSNFPVYEEIVVKNNCGFSIEPGDSKKIAKKVNVLLEDRTLWESMSKNAIAAVELKYNWETELRQLEKSYLQVLNKN